VTVHLIFPASGRERARRDRRAPRLPLGVRLLSEAGGEERAALHCAADRTSSPNSAVPNNAKLIAENPIELSLTPDKLVLAFRRWDEEVGSKKAK